MKLKRMKNAWLHESAILGPMGKDGPIGNSGPPGGFST